MKRTILLSAAALGLLPVCAQAHDMRRDRFEERPHSDFRRERHHSYRVLYRRDFRCGWIVDATYGCREEADRAAFRLGRCGFETRVCD